MIYFIWNHDGQLFERNDTIMTCYKYLENNFQKKNTEENLLYLNGCCNLYVDSLVFQSEVMIVLRQIYAIITVSSLQHKFVDMLCQSIDP